jgi:hypothetical protein
MPFAIPKSEVCEAYKRVKACQEAAGVDGDPNDNDKAKAATSKAKKLRRGISLIPVGERTGLGPRDAFYTRQFTRAARPFSAAD